MTDSEQPSGKTKELLRGHPLVEAEHVRQETDLGTDRVADRCDVVAKYLHGTAGGPCEPDQQVKGGRLAGPVGAEEPEYRAFLDNQVHGVERVFIAVGLCQGCGPDRCGHRWSVLIAGRCCRCLLYTSPSPRD